ncbi:MAG TPA: fumarate reductase/succinate dehydrogenase flavoprotein subunit [Negativicutes bacterium]|nr:fumarate reductase/succinate dehydrogenase flavoprotein subunit [Negativicutes bacterium]
MMTALSETISTDVLIIGGGTAGPMAAVKAKIQRPDVDVLLVDKATVRRGGSICRGMDAYNNVVVPGIATVEQYVESVRMMSDGIFDANLVRKTAEYSFSILKELENWGVAKFPKDKDGQYIVSQFHPTGKFLAEMRGDIKPKMEQLVREQGVKILNRTMATRILTTDGRATGAILFNIRTGKLTVCKAKAVIVCAGGQGRFALPDTGYLFGTFDCPYNAGEGFSMIYHAGGELANMEFMGISPMIKDYEGPGHSTFTRHGAYLVNVMGERFMPKYSEFAEHAPGGIRATAMRTEIAEGRGPIYYDLRHLSLDTIEIIKEGIFAAERPTEKEFFSKKGVDIGRDLIELTMSGPNLCGGHAPSGVVINEHGETTVAGLYAAGDVACTGWGFVGGAWVFGTLAGQHAAETVDDIATFPIDTNQVSEERKRLFAPLNSAGKVEPDELEYKIRRVIKPYLKSPKAGPRLNIALDYVRQFRDDLGKVRARDYHQIMKVTEISAIIDSLEMAARASLARTESRWGDAHFRVDYPEKDLDWGQHFVVIEKDQSSGAMTTSKKPVPISKLK